MKFSKIIAFVVISLHCFWATSQAQKLTYARVSTLQDAIQYLVKFGYLKDINEVASIFTSTINRDLLSPSNPAATALRVAFSAFQTYARLPVTGQFDEPTKGKMNTPRCGNKDIVQVPDIAAVVRNKRYATSGVNWQKIKLTYRISRFSESGFHPTTTMREVDKAFQIWANHTNLEFVRSDNSDDVDIELKFARLVHGDVEPFDGRGITLAHAFPPGPGIGGDIHFDDDEDWSSQVYSGTNFYHVMVHELGHALGLRHSDIEEAVMYAFARSFNPNFRLHEDDIEGIQSLYGEKGKLPERWDSSTMYPIITNVTTAPETPSTAQPTRPQDDSKPDLCAYAFQLDPNGAGIISANTERISYVFYGLPGHLDAAATYKGKTYFFKGDQYWRYDNRKIDGDFPRKISEGFPGIPNNLDAAFTWSGDENIYFFKGDKYWGFNDEELPPVASNYPLPISQWFGLPTKEIDAAFRSPNEGPTYFFKEGNYWLFDDENFQVAEADPPYPRSSRIMWFGCTSYRPGEGELREGWIRRTIKKIKSAIKGHFDNKIQFIKSLFS
ncbi:Matrix metalloproteinase-14 [Orchesella cincta]|uniref:Matrix metalloproteinase-14 n=1 Tax=Orchesella cincta TaxID=48709 RepID=A0A1D2MU34_ORCCI|nr:Matrix metalloproteinase-14 [Orchesella cincta]